MPGRQTVLMRAVFLSAAISFPGTAAPQPARYPVSEIPPPLLKDAHAVIREDESVFTVRDERRARLTVTRAVTILDKRGRGEGTLALSYDRFRKIRSLEGWLLDARGDVIRELEERDIHDASDIAAYSLYEDYRERRAELFHDQYPYTVVYRYEVAFEACLEWPRWHAQRSEIPVQFTRFEVKVPEGIMVRYWSNADSLKPMVSVDDGEQSFVWLARNLCQLSDEMMEEDIEARTSVVRTAPSKFRVEEYAGEMTTWSSFGRWFYNLSKDRDALPEPAIREIRELVQHVASPRERVTRVYRYMQDRTRYISVQLGIGSWQPFDATYVHERRYGDCKALANYTIALLKEAGVRAYPALIYSGNGVREIIAGFPSNQFNHAIVCVPMDRDSVWLECTSNTVAPGHVGSWNENRYALVVTPEGGVLVRTPSSRSHDNMQIRRGDVRLTMSGAADVAMHVTYTGNERENVRSAIADLPPADRERWVLEVLQVPNAQIQSYAFSGLDHGDTTLRVDVRLIAVHYGSGSEARMFFSPNFGDRYTHVPRAARLRRSPVRFRNPVLSLDTVVYHIPSNGTCEAVPERVSVNSSFGSFVASTILLNDSTIVFTRRLDLRDGWVPGVHYAEYRDFVSAMVISDRAQAVLVRRMR